ncbi:hypothetical protein M885DRAFT_517148 [Pelagophyceae sp. CCMP2097]|nr:hypothetical protein M885DRAFT_517148 [Pelagophyceae sp. CCMP2097]
MAMYGFYAGFVTATGVAIVLVGGVVAITMRPEPVYRAALKRIQNSPFVEMQMGRVAPGPLRAYTLEHGHLAGEGTTVIWRPPRVQLIFSLVGEKYDGVCSLECVKRGWLGTYDFTYIGVDVGNEQAERLLVEGDETQMVEQQDHLRGLVTFQKDRLQR